MSNSNFSSLSPKDFEELARDLLQAEWNVSLEAFKMGPDQGIDLRRISASEGTIIIQAKHSAGSSVSALISKLKKKELVKVQALNPERYILVTSLGMSPKNKEAVMGAMAPHIKSANDVISADDLEGLLARFPDIEKKNFKLWMTSTKVLESVLYNAEITQSNFEVEKIRSNIPKIVQSDAFERALQILDEKSVVIISGAPGIGKTTLAELILYCYLEREYQPVVMQNNVNEGKKLFARDKKQIFYFDDFLGQTFLGEGSDYLQTNQDKTLVAFMEQVSKAKHAKFILTTREHLLTRATRFSEHFSESSAVGSKCLLSIGDYSRFSKARILYNHLHFSDLPREYIDAILHEKFFLHIVDHEHFTPRLIEWMANYQRVEDVQPSNFQKYVLRLLDHPAEIWGRAFTNQTSIEAQDLLICLYSIGVISTLGVLEPAYSVYRNAACSERRASRTDGEFRKALSDLEGGFINLKQNTWGKSVNFLNPSIREFIGDVICNDISLIKRIIGSAVLFEQFKTVFDLLQNRNDAEKISSLMSDDEWLVRHAKKLLSDSTTSLETNLAYLINLSNSCETSIFHQVIEDLLSSIIEKNQKEHINVLGCAKALSAIGDADWVRCNVNFDIEDSIINELVKDSDSFTSDEWVEFLDVYEFDVEGREEFDKIIRNNMDHFASKGAWNEKYACHDLNSLEATLDSLSQLNSYYDIPVEGLMEAMKQSIEEYEKEDPYDDRGGWRNSGGAEKSDHASDDDIIDLFQSLEE